MVERLKWTAGNTARKAEEDAVKCSCRRQVFRPPSKQLHRLGSGLQRDADAEQVAALFASASLFVCVCHPAPGE